jgi:VWFA-related protein
MKAISIFVFFGCCVVCLAFGYPQQRRGEDAGSAFQLRTQLVELRAVVTDKQGRVIEGLKKDDFEISEKGRPQTISFFSEHRVADAYSPGRSEDETIRTYPQLRHTQSETRRSIVLLVDTLNLSGGSLLRVKQNLKRFVIERLGEHDEVVVSATGGMDASTAQLTNDRQTLLLAIDRLRFWGEEEVGYFNPTLAGAVRRKDEDAIRVAAGILKASGGDGVRTPQDKAYEVLTRAVFKRKAVAGSIRASAELLAKVAGQRLLLLISDGFSLMDLHGNTDTSDVRSAIDKALRSGVVIYSINAKGLEAPSEANASLRGISGDSATFGVLSRYVSAWEKDTLEGMNALAKDTGGNTFFRTNDLLAALREPLDENRVYYSLAYYPSKPFAQQSFIPISIRVKNHPNYHVRTQRGYFAADLRPAKNAKSGSPRERLFGALEEPIAYSTILISAVADYLEVETDKATVSLQMGIDGSKLSYTETNGRYSVNIEVAIAVFDNRSHLVTSHAERIRGNLSADELATAMVSGFHYVTRLGLKPGLYQIRSGACETETERMGTATSWVEVPDLSRSGLALSGIVLTEGEAGPGTKKGAEAAKPTSWRAVKSYRSGTLLAYYLRVYNLPADSESQTFIQSEISRGEHTVYKGDWQPLASRVSGKDTKGLDIGGQLSVALEPGFYELNISVKSLRLNKTVQRKVAFEIRG